MRVPVQNVLTEAKIELGRHLFFDPRLSASGRTACYRCHRNSDGTGGHTATTTTDTGEPYPRHAPSLWNVGYLPLLGWDGRARSLEEFIARYSWAVMLGVAEASQAAKAQEIDSIPEYHLAFRDAFAGLGATPTTIPMALGSYLRSLTCAATDYDRYLKGDQNAMSAEQVRGLENFGERAECTNCHAPPFFSDAYAQSGEGFRHTGIGACCVAPNEVDAGRMAVTEDVNDWAAFRTPSLRNATMTPPYTHDGGYSSLLELMPIMAGGGLPTPSVDCRLQDCRITYREAQDVVSFLGALRCERQMERPEKPLGHGI